MTNRRDFLRAAPLGLLALGGLKPKGLRLSADSKSAFYDRHLMARHPWCTVDGVKQQHVTEASEADGWCDVLVMNGEGRPLPDSVGRLKRHRVFGAVHIGFEVP